MYLDSKCCASDPGAEVTGAAGQLVSQVLGAMLGLPTDGGLLVPSQLLCPYSGQQQALGVTCLSPGPSMGRQVKEEQGFSQASEAEGKWLMVTSAVC